MECGIFTVMAQNKSTSPNPAERTSARQLGRASLGLSVAGIIIGVFVYVVIIIANMGDTIHNSAYTIPTTPFPWIPGSFR